MKARYSSSSPDPVAAARDAAAAFGTAAKRSTISSSAAGGSAEGEGARALSVSAAMQLAKGALEGVEVCLVGEVSELSNKPGYKAVYFTVKDSASSLPCMMWNNRYRAAHVKLAVGQLVELRGRFTLYAAKGRMNFDVSRISLAGEGKLRAQVAELARKLEAQGLMDPARKQAIPRMPEVIGVVTSPRGDAVHDVLRTLRRRFPVASVLLAGVPVEGTGAAAGIVEGMRAVAHAGAEVILVVRGGGSYEDLMPFNDEYLARMIAKCPVPVVTGIGHEPDTSIADMVADLRASTPTAAAEKVSPAKESLDALFDSRAGSLNFCVARVLERASSQLEHAASRPVLSDPNSLFAAEAQGLDLAADRLARALPANIERDRSLVDHDRARLRLALSRALADQRAQVEQARRSLLSAGSTIAAPFSHKVGLAAGKLDALSPLSVIARGYSITRNDKGALVKSIEQVSVGSAIEVSVSDGAIRARVESTRPIVCDVVSMKGDQQ